MTDSMGALIFGVLVIGMEILVMVKRGRGWGRDSTRMVGLTVVVVAAMFLGISTVPLERLSAAYTLLGTIAGFFIGRNEPTSSPAAA